MSKEKQAVLKIAGVFISTVIGAGFASGQEIVTFFIRYGRSGLLGLGVAGALSFYMVGEFYPAYIKIRFGRIRNSPIRLRGGRRAVC